MYSTDFKNCIIRIRNEYNYTYWFISKLFNISISTISRWINNIRNIKLNCKSTKLNKPIIIELINNIIKINPFYTTFEVNKHLQSNEIFVSNELLRLFLRKKLKYTIKKPHFYPKVSSSEEKTKIFLNKIKNIKFFVAIDEVGFSSNVRPLQGLSKKGERLYTL
jgi:transposase